MTPEELAESVKRLRDAMAERYKMTNLTTQDIAHVEFQSAVYFPEAIQTINALVELVGEMEKAMKTNVAQCSKMHHGKKDQNHEDFGRCPPVERYCAALTKAAPIAELARKE